jgi:hypothetical protein
MDTPEKYGEIPGWYLRWARVCLSTPKPINGGGFLQKFTKTVRSTLLLLWELSTSNHNNA